MTHNLVGQTFGRLKAVRFVGIEKGRSLHECVCSCGNTITVKSKYLVNGDTKSCGCLVKENAIANGKATATHGLTNHPIMKVWSSMKDRCLNKKCHAYADYGGRGITVSEPWMNFKTFFDDVFPTYKKGLELDRIDNNKGYSKDNFRWATPTENKRNRRNSIHITANGITKHIAEWASDTGISIYSIRARLRAGKVGAVAVFGSSAYKSTKNSNG